MDYAGTLQINGSYYRMVREQGKRGISLEYVDEPPWQGQVPGMVSDPSFTWHQGGFKSRQGVGGTREYGVNTDARYPFRLLPGPKIHNLVLSVDPAIGPITSFFEALGWIFVTAGRFIYRINPSTFAVNFSRDVGVGVNAIMGLRWEDDFGLVTTDTATNSLWKFIAIGGGPDNWQQTSSVSAYRLAAGINRLFKVSKTGELKNIATGLDPMVEGNWGDQVQVGEKTTQPTGMVAYERTTFVSKPEGVFGVSEEGLGVPIIKRMARDANNGNGMTVVDPYVYVPHAHGLYRWSPGEVQSVGLEKELMNESPVTSAIQSMIAVGQWYYALTQVGPWVYILVGRDKQGDEPSFGPIVWDTWARFPTALQTPSRAIWFSTLTSPPTLWFARDTQVSYIIMPTTGGTPDVNSTDYRFALSGDHYTAKYKFDDRNSKGFPKIKVEGRNLSATKYWDFAYSLDGGAYVAVDYAGQVMRHNTNGVREFLLPPSIVGREIQWRFTFSSNSETIPPELTYFEPYAVPQSKKIPVWSTLLWLEEGIRHETGIERRTALEQLNALITLAESHAPVVCSGPWGTKNMFVRSFKVQSNIQDGTAEGVLVADITLQEWE